MSYKNIHSHSIKCSLKAYQFLYSFLEEAFGRTEIGSLEHGALIQVLAKLGCHLEKQERKRPKQGKRRPTTLKLLPVEVSVIRLMLSRYRNEPYLRETDAIFYGFLSPILDGLMYKELI